MYNIIVVMRCKSSVSLESHTKCLKKSIFFMSYQVYCFVCYVPSCCYWLIGFWVFILMDYKSMLFHKEICLMNNVKWPNYYYFFFTNKIILAVLFVYLSLYYLLKPVNRFQLNLGESHFWWRSKSSFLTLPDYYHFKPFWCFLELYVLRCQFRSRFT